ncbi:glycoside hydrolase [Pluteus cervinus]|uniref:Glycoside hydrolase n=1 Tax=Pluteus cervinus TaxID=181527 RepID=A0ACD3AT10_9AGAR|nr:glycoside hydrolase [Pluteus cervinus]
MAERPVSVADSLVAPASIPLHHNDHDPFFEPPRASFLAATDSSGSVRDITAPSTPAQNNAPLLPASHRFANDSEVQLEKTTPDAEEPKPRRWRLYLGLLALLVVVVLVVVLPVFFTVIKPKQNAVNESSHGSSSAPTAHGSSPSGAPAVPSGAITGGDGSTVTTVDGSTFVYNNQFGGYWWHDPNDPFNNNARPNSWTPPLNQSWTWGQDRVFGVNLGGWFVLEPFISPALFQKYPGASDEWTLSTAMAADTSAGGGLQQLEDHYNTFITEQDIAEIAGAGMNWVRIPIPFWAVDKWPGEPFLAQTSWKYILRAIEWCRKYGVRVNIDLHTIPGSQNGYNHSGKGGEVDFLNGVMGFANAQRAMDYIRILSEFFAQPQYNEVIGMFGIMNEPLLDTIGRQQLSSFYLETYQMIRGITGIGAGKGFYISFHDGFSGFGNWDGFLAGADRIALDTHPYMSFDTTISTAPIDTGTGAGAGGPWPGQACTRWASAMNSSQTGFGITTAGEYSNGINDCGLFLRGISGDHTYTGDCSVWQDSSNWSEGTKAGLLQFALASMDALGDTFFWTWKIGNSTAGIVESPLWSYQLGLQGGWMPTDPRTSVGTCASLGVSGPIFDGQYESWQTGGAGAGQLAAAATDSFPWPPPSISNAGAPSLLPSYTPTAPIPTLPPISLTPTPKPTVNVGDGWFNAQDTAGAMTTIEGCTYPDAWGALNAAIPPVCGGGDLGAQTAVLPLPLTTSTDDDSVPPVATAPPVPGLPTRSIPVVPTVIPIGAR